MTASKNPYGTDEGIPIKGKEPEFFQWAREQELKSREHLPDELQKKREESEQALRDRMNS